MKKVLLGTLAVLTLAACSKDEVVQQNPNDAITFSATTNKAISRAADGYCNDALPTTFNVWAAAQGKLYFAKEEYKQYDDGGTKKYKPTSGVMRYWPEGASATVDFFATKNENGTEKFIYSGTTSLAFEGFAVNNTVSAQTDFIYAVNKGASKGSTGTTTLNFRHALSQIEFQAKNQNSKIYVEIDGVSVKQVNSVGDFSVDVATTNNFQDHTLGTADTDSRVGRCSWDVKDSKADYDVTFTATAVGTTETSLTVTDATGEFNPNTMYLLPQTLTAWNKSAAASTQTDSYFIVNALIYNVAGASVDKDKDVVVWGDNTSGTWKSKPIAIPVPTSTTWEDGKRYVYTFVFTTDGNGGYDPDHNTPVLTPITLQVTVDDFVDAGNKDVTMDK
ncbi:MAG: fimbrillin family protein [Bacteroidales bacterium]|nr:fimbrillin family protein [Bacteroidales bacterium]MDD6851923.1 fimbrillin family protein [Bacteroidales bacterium]